MRASSLSNPGIVSLLNRYFVSVYVSNEDYAEKGPAPAEEKAERNRIYQEALKARLSTGTVHAYLLDPDGHPIDSLHVATAARVEPLTAMLERNIEKSKWVAGKPLVEPRPQSVAPAAAEDQLVLHLIARNMQRQGQEIVPVQAKLGETRSAGWGSYPVENWIVLAKEDWRKLLPAGERRVGETWELDADAAARFLVHFYPSSENNDVRTNRIDRQTLRATVVSVRDGVARARLEGSLRMKHPFYPKREDGRFVDASLVGFLEFETSGARIRSLQLATEQATYGQTLFGVVVRSVP
jgi:hypothetical protein